MDRRKSKVIMTLKEDIIQDSYIDLRVYKEAKSLISNGYEVSLICYNTKKSKLRIENYDKIEILRVLNEYSSFSIVRYFQKKMRCFKIAKMIHENSPDVIHAHDLDTLLEGSIAKIRSKKPLIYDSHEDFPKYLRDDYPEFLNIKNSLVKKAIGYVYYVKAIFLERLLLLFFVNKVITVNSVIAKKFESICETTIVMNCKNTLEDIKDKNDTFKATLGFLTSDFLVVYVGGIFKGRGYELLAEISLSLERNVKILVIGDGELREKLERKVNEMNINNIIFTGQIPYQEVLSYISIADVGIILFEPTSNNLVGSPNKLFDYMSGSIPVIASNFPVMRQIITDNECGLLVNPLSVEEIVTAINYLKNNPEKKEQMGQNARKAVIKEYNWENQEKKLLKLYKEL